MPYTYDKELALEILKQILESLRKIEKKKFKTHPRIYLPGVRSFHQRLF